MMMYVCILCTKVKVVEGTKAMCYVCYCTREKEVQKVQILQFEYLSSTCVQVLYYMFKFDDRKNKLKFYLLKLL